MRQSRTIKATAPVKSTPVTTVPDTKKPAGRFAVKATPKLENVDAPVVKMLQNSRIPDTLASVLEAWKVLGNGWYTTLEAELELFSRGMQIEGGIDINAVRSLAFMGYMLRKDPDDTVFRTIRYKISKEGLKALGVKENLGAEKEVGSAYIRGPRGGVQKKVDTTVVDGVKTVQTEMFQSGECPVCEGEGIDPDSGGECERCEGSGMEPDSVSDPTPPREKTPVGRGKGKGWSVSAKSKPTENHWPLKTEPKPVQECPKCAGTGKMVRGRLCDACEGSGLVEVVTIADLELKDKPNGKKPKFQIKR